MRFEPKYTITPDIAGNLMVIEGVRQSVVGLAITPRVLANLQKTARLYATHYSTQIEGNRLTVKEIEEVLEKSQHFPGRERDEWEIKGYYAALDYLEALVRKNAPVTEKVIQTLHGFVIHQGKGKPKPTPYRDGQNVIKDSRSGGTVYMPPEAKDVPRLMKELVKWNVQTKEVPVPIAAAIAHYQFATIHPYYDGNGRTARLLTTLILHLRGYGLKGIYALESYYAEDLGAYYDALTIGPSHNYYLGREQADITTWLAYFIQGMAVSFENIRRQAAQMAGEGVGDVSSVLRKLNSRQRKALELFRDQREITASDLVRLFGIKPRTATAWCNKWVEENFLVMTNPSRKARRYALAGVYEALYG